jgi:cytochrome c biogenesis protein CcmG/thiol:disulfide interchange protein DsbE
MKKRLFIVLPLFTFIILCVFFIRGLSMDPKAVPSALIGQPFPAFTSTDLMTNKKLTNQIFVHKVSVLNVFASWCTACRAESTVIAAIAKTSGITLYGLNYKDDPALAKNFLGIFGEPYKSIIQDPQGTIGLNLGVYGVPETYIVDKAGIIRYKWIGQLSLQDWQNTVLPEVRKWE